MARPREFDMVQTLNNAMDVFWAKGYASTSLDDLLSSMKIGKGSFYQAFKSKHNLYLLTLEMYKDYMTDRAKSIVSGKKGLKAVQALFETMIDEMYSGEIKKGCFICNAAVENSGKDFQINKLTSSGFNNFIEILSSLVEKAQKKGEISKEHDARDIANWLFNTLYGLTILGKSNIKKSTLKMIAKNSLDIIKQKF